MANRFMTPVSMLTLEKNTKTVFAKITFGSTGAPTLDVVNSKGILSVTRVSAGKYTFVFGSTSNNANLLDVYVKLMAIKHVFNSGASAPAAPGMYISANAVSTVGTASITLVFNSAGTATDPASGEIAYLQFIFGDSTAP